DFAGLEAGHRGVPPEAQSLELRADHHAIGAAVHRPQLPGERVLRARVERRREAGVAPGAGPGVRGIRIEALAAGRERFLVADQRAIRGVRSDDRGLVPRLPEHFVAAEERQVDAGVARALDVGALLPRPVLVVADREERLRRDGTRQADGAAGAEAIGVDAGPVLGVVAVGLQPADHRVVAGAVVARAVAVEARAAGGESRVLVVGLPRRVGGLEEDVGLPRIVADDEDDVAGAAVVRAPRPRDVDARGQPGRVERAGDTPVAAVHQADGRVLGTHRLVLRRDDLLRRRHHRGHEARAQALV